MIYSISCDYLKLAIINISRAFTRLILYTIYEYHDMVLIMNAYDSVELTAPATARINS